jgi:hypothetical protein
MRDTAELHQQLNTTVLQPTSVNSNDDTLFSDTAVSPS